MHAMATSHDAEKAPPTNAERPLDTSPSPFRDLSDKALARDDDSKEDIAYSLGIDQSVPVLPSWARWVPFQWNRATAWSGLNVNGKKLIRCVELFAGLAILFFGYDQ